MKMHLIGVFRHGIVNKQRPIKMTDQISTVNNRIVQILYKVINEIGREHPRLEAPLLQLNNFVQENKNIYVLAFLECIVTQGVLRDVEEYFPPFGDTTGNLDQGFSST